MLYSQALTRSSDRSEIYRSEATAIYFGARSVDERSIFGARPLL